jgi:hypothetical protein
MSGEAGGFGALLRARRQSAGLSQQEVAERSGLAIRTISDLERGRTRWPYPDSVHRLADALELSGAPRAEFIAAARRRLAVPPRPVPPRPVPPMPVPHRPPACRLAAAGPAALGHMAAEFSGKPASGWCRGFCPLRYLASSGGVISWRP